MKYSAMILTISVFYSTMASENPASPSSQKPVSIPPRIVLRKKSSRGRIHSSSDALSIESPNSSPRSQESTPRSQSPGRQRPNNPDSPRSASLSSLLNSFANKWSERLDAGTASTEDYAKSIENLASALHALASQEAHSAAKQDEPQDV